MVGRVIDLFYLTEDSYEEKPLALKGGASREGNLILYCAPSCLPAGRDPALKGGARGAPAGQVPELSRIAPHNKGKQ